MIYALADYVAAGIMSDKQRAAIETAIEERRTLLIAGGTGSGKTTLVNAAIAHLAARCPSDRLLILEDTVEIQCTSSNAVALRTSETVGLRRLLRATLRLRPDRILVGEVRGAEALDLLKAWNTGHPGGIATLHANSAASALTRLESLVAEATAAPPQAMIAAAIDVIAVIVKTDIGRRITELVRVGGFAHGAYRLVKEDTP